MNNVVVVRRLDSHGNLNRNAHRLFDGKPRLLLNILLEGDSLHQLHDDIVILTLLAHIIDIDDIGVHKTRRSLCLDAELGHKIGVFAEFLF